VASPFISQIFSTFTQQSEIKTAPVGWISVAHPPTWAWWMRYAYPPYKYGFAQSVTIIPNCGVIAIIRLACPELAGSVTAFNAVSLNQKSIMLGKPPVIACKMMATFQLTEKGLTERGRVFFKLSICQ
jgi:hypothetical protein